MTHVVVAIVDGSVLVTLACLAVATTVLLVRAVTVGGRREERPDEHDALAESRFTVRVTLVVPIAEPKGLRDAVGRTIGALLALNYPDLEVVVVANAGDPVTWTALQQEWELEPRELFYRQSLPTAPVRMIYRSGRDSRLVIAVTPTTSAAALWNCGVNLARGRFVVMIDPRVVFDSNALLGAMTAPMRDPTTVVASISHLEAHADDECSTHRRLTASIETLTSARAELESRVLWSDDTGAVSPQDALVVWQRDALIAAGGFSTTAFDPELDMLARLQSLTAHGAEGGRSCGRVIRTATLFGVTPLRSLGSLLRRSIRRQAAMAHVMNTARASGPAARPLFRRVMVTELIAPLAVAWLVGAVCLEALAGWQRWWNVVLVVALVAFGRGAVTAAALLVRGAAPGAPEGARLARLLALAPLETVLTGVPMAVARVAGLAAAARPVARGQAGI